MTFSHEVTEGIVADLRGRKGIGDEWGMIDSDIQDSIRETWAEIIQRQLAQFASDPAVIERGARAMAAESAKRFPIARFPKTGYHEDWDKWVLPDQDAYCDYARVALRACLGIEGEERT